jgi:hypothetical protein
MSHSLAKTSVGLANTASTAASTALGTIVLCTIALLCTLLMPRPGQGQEPNTPAQSGEGALRVFFDCSGRSCDSRYYRTEIDWVNWVRDRTLAQVHLIVTSQRNASGGNEFVFDFLGLEELAGQDDRLTYVSLGSDTSEESLSGIAEVLAIGLARYSVLAGVGEGLQVARTGQARELNLLVTGDQVVDPWDFWVFNVGANGNYSAESTESDARVRGNLSASRTTTTWKINFRGNGSYRRDEKDLSDGSTSLDTRTDWNVTQEVVYALAEHVSVGVEARESSSTRSNQDLGIEVLSGIEYSVWPYEEAPRRSLTASYRVGVQYFDWEEITVFLETAEARPSQALQLRLFQRQPWGTSFVSLEASSFLDKVSQHRIEMDANVSVRIFRGLRLNIGGGVERIRDQIFLRLAEFSDEEILLGRFQRESSYAIDFRVGLSYQFGSIFNNVVNNRF